MANASTAFGSPGGTAAGLSVACIGAESTIFRTNTTKKIAGHIRPVPGSYTTRQMGYQPTTSELAAGVLSLRFGTVGVAKTRIKESEGADGTWRSGTGCGESKGNGGTGWNSISGLAGIGSWIDDEQFPWRPGRGNSLPGPSDIAAVGHRN